VIIKNEHLKLHSVIMLELAEGTKKFMEYLRQDRWPLDQDLNPNRPEHEAEFWSFNSNIQY